jgi:hypothetical protein
MGQIKILFRAIALILPLFITIVGTSQNAPIGCNEKFFVSYGSNNQSGSQTTVNQLSITAGSITAVSFPISPNSVGFNGIGLNPIDGYMYGMRYPANNQRVRLVRVGLGTPNNVTDLGEVNNASGSMLQDEVIVYAGCFDANGTYYFVTTNDRLFSMPASEIGNGVNQRRATYIATLNVPDYIVDIAIDPTNGQMYGVTVNNDFGVYTINKTTGAVTRRGTYPNSGSAMIGLFFTEDGNLYAYRTNGAFYQLNKNTGAGTYAGNGPSYQFADGCSCSFRVGHDLDAPTAICPTTQNNGQPAFNFTLSIQNQSGAARTGTTYTLVLSNRFSFTQTAAVISANFAAAGLTNSGAVLSSVSGGTNNRLVVNNMAIPNLAAVPNVLMGAKLINHVGFTTANFQSTISGLPAGIGGTDISNDPKTPTPDDATVIGRCAGTPLSVKMLSFTGNYKNNVTQLNWKTENEINFDRFEVERSMDGSSFVMMGSEKAKGSANGGDGDYSYADNLSAIPGNVFYYRLIIMDIDGNFSYSKIILVKRDQTISDAISIVPNPVYKGAPVSLLYTSERGGRADIRVIDMTGKVLITQTAIIREGTNTISVEGLSKLMPGSYIMQVSHNERLGVTKFIIGH